MAAAVLNSTTVYSACWKRNSSGLAGLSIEALNSFHTAFNNVRIVLVDACCMIGSGLLQQMNSRLQHILHDYDRLFDWMNMVFYGDL